MLLLRATHIGPEVVFPATHIRLKLFLRPSRRRCGEVGRRRCGVAQAMVDVVERVGVRVGVFGREEVFSHAG